MEAPYPLDRCTLVLLVRPADAPEMSEERLDELQQQHLAFVQRMRDAGHVAAAGPVMNQPDERLRGLCLYLTGPDEAKRLAAQDPSVRAGRMAVEVMDWYTREGELQLRPWSAAQAM
jgi:uncharacterized protein YciI